MELLLEMEITGRLHGHFTQRDQTTSISAYDGHAALASLSKATDDLLQYGRGECFWEMATGCYRLLFRHAEDDTVRIAVLWANGIVTGWEHILWSECPAAEWTMTVRSALEAVGGDFASGLRDATSG
ncbi:MAG: hypothetical protein IT169_02875 [Bryobacterales bacterium]|nr:hypothetical protein [Bryobacterales bacterium]